MKGWRYFSSQIGGICIGILTFRHTEIKNMQMKRSFRLYLNLAAAVFGLLASAPMWAQSIKILPDADTVYACSDSTLLLIASGGTAFQWSSPDYSISDPGSDTLRVSGPEGATFHFVLSGVISGNRFQDTATVIFTKPTLSLRALDSMTVCRGTPVRLKATTNTGGYGLQWSPGDGLSFTANLEQVVARPSFTTTYTATLHLTGCEIRETVTVTIAPPRVDFAVSDTIELCLGTKLPLLVTTSTGNGQGLRWYSSDGSLRDSLKLLVEVAPKINTTYYASFTHNGCVILDSVFVKVDSLPTLRIEADPKKDVYCQGQLVTLKSETFEPFLYPGVKHKWFPNKGFETPDSLWNMVITTQDTTRYFRESKIGGCTDTAEILIPVIKPKDITITPVDPVICPGETVQLLATFEGKGEIKWTPEQNISCLECNNPRVTPPNSTAYTITVTEEGCPSSKSVNITVLSIPQAPVPINPTICRGDSITLFLANPEAGVDYRWVSPQIPALDARIARLTVAPSTNTTYTLSAQRGNCPAVNVTTTVNVIQPADVTVPAAQRLCPGQNITLTATGTAPAGVNQSYQWTWNNGQSSSAGPILTVNNLRQTTVFNLIYSWGQNCGTITKSVVVTVDAVPVINGFTYNPPQAPSEGVPLGDAITVSASTTPPNPTGITYLWKANGEDISGSGSSLTHKPTKNPTTYSLTIRTANGCEVTLTTPPIRVTLPEFDVPNAFTPDGDGNNDFFNVVFTGNVEIVEFRIWNRWGQLVYNNDNKSTGWDGKSGGRDAPSDVYVYNIVLRFPDGQEFVRRGDVSLIR